MQISTYASSNTLVRYASAAHCSASMAVTVQRRWSREKFSAVSFT